MNGAYHLPKPTKINLSKNGNMSKRYSDPVRGLTGLMGLLSNQSILKEINLDYPLKELMLKLKLQNFWPPDVKSCLMGKHRDAGKDWGKEEKGTTEDEMVGWHHWVNGHEFEKILGERKDREAWCAAVSWVAKSRTWLFVRLNWTEQQPQ